jgi:hypothetical protein
MIDDCDCGTVGGMTDWQGEPKYSEKTCSLAALSTTNLTWPIPGSGAGSRRGELMPPRLEYGTACICSYLKDFDVLAFIQRHKPHSHDTLGHIQFTEKKKTQKMCKEAAVIRPGCGSRDTQFAANILKK